MPHNTPVCAKSTTAHPEGRTGTTAGYNAHLHAKEPPCVECAEARNEYRRAKNPVWQARIFWSRFPACFRPTKSHPNGRTGTCAGYQAHLHRGESACSPCLRAQTNRGLQYRNSSEGRLESHRASNSVAAKAWRERNPEKAHEAKWKVIDKNRMAARVAKDVPCTDCEIKYPYYVMEFDHLDPDTKQFNVSAGVMSASYERLIAEIAKCEVVCANCHAERTEQRRRRRKEANSGAVD